MSTAAEAPRRAADGRVRFVDAARAIAVLSMLAANLVNVFMAERPRWLSHNLGDELQPFDLPAPIFQFLLGVSLVLFLARRRRSARHARWLAVRRFLLLMLLGAVLDAIAAGRLELRWGVLQTLGVGGLAATALAAASDAAILAVAAAILVAHYGPGNNEVHRSALDCLPFVPLTLLGYVVGRPFAFGDRRAFHRRAITVAVVCLALALMLRASGVFFNKVIGSGSFVTLAAAASAGLLAALERLEESGVEFPAPLLVLGANALTAWVLQYVVIYYPLALFTGGTHALPGIGGALLVIASLAVISALTLLLARRGVRVPL